MRGGFGLVLWESGIPEMGIETESQNHFSRRSETSGELPAVIGVKCKGQGSFDCGRSLRFRKDQSSLGMTRGGERPSAAKAGDYFMGLAAWLKPCPSSKPCAARAKSKSPLLAKDARNGAPGLRMAEA